MAVDILHPLATIDWQECPGPLPLDTTPRHHVVAIKDKLYTSIVDYPDTYGENRHFICSTSSTFTSWTVHEPPAFLECFGLTSYHSQLLVVGGKERGEATNKVWTSDTGLADWQLSLPPMPGRHESPIVTSTGPFPECVIVAGESDTNITILDVLLEEQWFTVPATLRRPQYLEHISVHNGIVYINASERSKNDVLIQCPLESLLTACVQSHDLRLQLKQITSSTLTGYENCNIFGQIVTCGEQLHVLHHELTDVDSTPTPRQYVYAGDLPKCVGIGFLTTLPTNELLVATCAHRLSRRWIVSKGSIRRCQYNLDDQFSISALHKLEAAGIPVLSSLAPLYKELASALEIPEAEIEKKRSRRFRPTHTPTQQQLINVDLRIKLWLSGESFLIPSWRSLYATLRRLGLKELSQQIAEYLGGAKSLNQVCLSVITSALLEHRGSLEPDQLHVRLPDYVPPRDKQLIMYNYKIARCQVLYE